MKDVYKKYVNESALPQIFCPGCGTGTIFNAFIRAVDEMGLTDKDICLYSGAGCYGWGPVYLNFDCCKYIHGRCIAAAEATALVCPDKKVVVFTGDGDNYAIGANHYIHGARRNADITVIIVNNFIYGMTGGQKAPTTPYEVKTKTSPFGNDERPFDDVELARAVGVTYYARWTPAHPRQLQKAIMDAMNHKGFSVVEVISQCPTTAGRNIFGMNNGYEVLDYIKEHSYILKKGDEPNKDDPRYALGLIFEYDRPTHHEEIERIRRRVNNEG